jgi:chromate reductase, NAD(P)H dehydrogenase (quinone)
LPAVSALRESVRRSHGLPIATPEYNHGVPGVLKNAIDWRDRFVELLARLTPALRESI